VAVAEVSSLGRPETLAGGQRHFATKSSAKRSIGAR